MVLGTWGFKGVSRYKGGLDVASRRYQWDASQ